MTNEMKIVGNYNISVEEMEKWCIENGYTYEKTEKTFTIISNQPERSKREHYVCPECLNNYSKEDCKLRCGAPNLMET